MVIITRRQNWGNRPFSRLDKKKYDSITQIHKTNLERWKIEKLVSNLGFGVEFTATWMRNDPKSMYGGGTKPQCAKDKTE